MLAKQRLVPIKELNKKVAYHDPCALGRKNGVYDEPREVLKSIPGLELVEIPNFNRENSICCGGGKVLAVACPYCLQMFEDSVKTMDVDLEVKDIAELLAESLEETN